MDPWEGPKENYFFDSIHRISETGSSRFAQDDGGLYRHSEERSDVRIQKNPYFDLSILNNSTHKVFLGLDPRIQNENRL